MSKLTVGRLELHIVKEDHEEEEEEEDEIDESRTTVYEKIFLGVVLVYMTLDIYSKYKKLKKI